MKVSVVSRVFNEELILREFLDHYRKVIVNENN